MASARSFLALVVVTCVAVSTAGVIALSRSRDQTTIRLPAHQPAVDVAGARGWAWPDGTPGWRAGERIDGYLAAGMQPVELDAARLAAARAGLDSDDVRVISSTRADRRGPLAILAAPTLEQSPVQTCVAAVLQDEAAVRWRCPSELARSRVVVASARYTWTYRADATKHPLYLVGVARGDVRRVVLEAPGVRETLYTRGRTWGEFRSAVMLGAPARLKIFGRRGLVETLPLDVKPGTQRVFG